MAIENSQKGVELEGSDSEASCNTGFKIPDVPKPNTGADDVADWAAEVNLTRMAALCTMMIMMMTMMIMLIRCVQACGNCDKGWTVF